VRTTGPTVALCLLVCVSLFGGGIASLSAANVAPQRPKALAIAPGGGLYIEERARDQILERLPGGRFIVVAGTGRAGFSGDGGRAAAAKLRNPAGMAVAADGTLYIADKGNNRVRAISPDGRITTVAGDGHFGWVTTGTAALRANLGGPSAVAVGPDRRLYIALGGSNEIVRLNRDGTLTLVAGSRRFAGVHGVGGPAMVGSPDGPSGLAFDGAGNLFIAGENTKALLMIDREGFLRSPIGGTGFYPRGDGGLAESRRGTVLAMQTQAIEQLTPAGATTIYSFAHRRVNPIPGGFLPNGLAVAPNGTIYTDTDGANGWSTGAAIIALGSNHRVSLLWKG
jgi:sugar lactone lactonase YvrE